MENFYTILGVSNDANETQIKKAYRQLSFEYHPDKNPGNSEKEEKYKKINEAYDILKDSQKRKQYDFEMMIGGNRDPFANHMDVDLTDILGQMFGGFNPERMHQKSKTKSKRPMFNQMDDVVFMQFPPPMHQHHTMPPHVQEEKIKEDIVEDIHHNHEITFQQAYEGACEPIKISRQITVGNQSYEEIETLYVNIPSGIDHNEIITLVDKGNVKDKQQSDVKIHMLLKPDVIFQRQGMDLIVHHHISFKESLLGFTFALTHINGQNLKLNNPKGKIIMDQNKKIIKQLGFKRGDKIGNLIIEFHVKQPEPLNETQIELLEQIFQNKSDT